MIWWMGNLPHPNGLRAGGGGAWCALRVGIKARVCSLFQMKLNKLCYVFLGSTSLTLKLTLKNRRRPLSLLLRLTKLSDLVLEGQKLLYLGVASEKQSNAVDVNGYAVGSSSDWAVFLGVNEDRPPLFLREYPCCAPNSPRRDARAQQMNHDASLSPVTICCRFTSAWSPSLICMKPDTAQA